MLWECQHKWPSILVPIFKGKSNTINSSWHRAGKLVEKVLKRLCRILTINEMQFGYMPEKGTIALILTILSLEMISLVMACLKEKLTHVVSAA